MQKIDDDGSPITANKTQTPILRRIAPLLVFVLILFTVQNWWRLELLINPIDNAAIKEEDVVLYTTAWCPYCRKARDYFEQANIPYTEYDVEKSARAYQEYQQISGRGVPVIRIGDRIIQGYNPASIRDALAALE
ncbi:glutaredoxin domain-containing protein [Oceanicoccus sp. KOV_DT_Chl]|uniref:glutaredoxin domain-containing protein n=1 Tax=Oceanicoccus sp. KOV_DT_Chl TaxID=1904639 RepID=UPI000C7BC33B|nr:glutaredoxin domain-containing protein [Oceanicoccus sp. KOV_DT_Chl]